MDASKIYVTLLKGLLVLAGLGYLTAKDFDHAAKQSARDVRRGLISLKALNRQLGM